MNMGQKIKRLRRFRGMTQKELGLKLGFSEQTADVRIAQYESGSRAPRPELHKAISHALGVSFSYLQDHSVDSVTDIMYMLFDIDDAHGYPYH